MKLFIHLLCPGNPTGIRTWTDSPLRVASQRSNQLGQRVRPAGEKLAGRLDCHTSKYIWKYRLPNGGHLFRGGGGWVKAPDQALYSLSHNLLIVLMS